MRAVAGVRRIKRPGLLEMYQAHSSSTKYVPAVLGGEVGDVLSPGVGNLCN